MSDILLFGTILFDDFCGEKLIGGCSTNVAMHIAKLSAGEKEKHKLNAVIVSKVGKDALGRDAVKQFENVGVSTTFISQDSKHPTGRVLVEVDEQGIPSYTIEKDTAYDYISLSDEQKAVLSKYNFKCIYFGSIDQRGSLSAGTLKKILADFYFEFRFYDINLREGNYTREIIEFSLSNTDIFKMNTDECYKLSDIFGLDLQEAEMARWLFDTYKIKIIIITKDEDGATVYTKTKQEHIAGIKIKVKDTVGAGDAFSAGFISEYIKSKNPFKAAKIGNRLGAYVASKKGAVPDYDKSIIPEV